MIKNKKYIVIALVIVGLIGAFFGYKYFAKKSQEEDRYKLAKIETRDITQTVSANGTINPVTMVSVGTQVSGTVKKIFVDYNSQVKEGQILAELDPVLFNAQLAQSSAQVSSAKASLDLAEANFKRSNDLFEKGYISKQEFDQSKQAMLAAKAALLQSTAKENQDKSNLNFSIIRSPVDGVVVDKQIDVGQTVAASYQTPTLFKIAKDMRKMQINTSFAEADIGKIKVGQKATFTVDAYMGKVFEGEVRQIRLAATITSNVVTYDVVISVNNPDELLKPSMTAFVNVIIKEEKNALTIPNAALRFKPSNLQRDASSAKPSGAKQQNSVSIYVLRNGVLTPIKVQIGATDGRFSQIITNELKDGDEVVVSDALASQKDDAKGPPRMF